MLSKQRKQKNAVKRAFQQFRKSNLYDFPAVGKDSVKTLLKLSWQWVKFRKGCLYDFSAVRKDSVQTLLKLHLQ